MDRKIILLFVFFIVIFNLYFVEASSSQPNVISLGDSSLDYPGAKLYYCGSCINNGESVLLVPGWSNEANGNEEDWGALERELEGQYYDVWKLSYYPRNMSNHKNAFLISEAIQRIKEKTGVSKVHVIAHSMGGLAVRGYIQDMAVNSNGNKVFYNSDIDKLVLIASPMYGSYLANLLDETYSKEMGEKVSSECKNFILKYNLQGSSKATEDLQIGSDFTWELNNQNLNEEIDYLTISGSGLFDQVTLPIPIPKETKCFSNYGETNDGLVSLFNSILLNENYPLIVLNFPHIDNPIGWIGIYKYQVTGILSSLFFQGDLNSITASNESLFDFNRPVIYYKSETDNTGPTPQELQNKGSFIIQVKPLHEQIINYTSLTIKKGNNDPILLEANRDSWRFFPLKYNAINDFTTLIDQGNYDLFINNKDTNIDINIEAGQIKLIQLNFDKDGDQVDDINLGGHDCNDNDATIHAANPDSPLIPAALEICDGKDNNCDGEIDEGLDCTPICSPNWQCTSWSNCNNNTQTRTCSDTNQCNILIDKPSELQSCTPPICTPSWSCDSWSSCHDDEKTRGCTDLNNCGTTEGKPDESDSCSSSSSTHHHTSSSASNNQLIFGEPIVLTTQTTPTPKETAPKLIEISLTNDKDNQDEITGLAISDKSEGNLKFILIIFSILFFSILLILFLKLTTMEKHKKIN